MISSIRFLFSRTAAGMVLAAVLLAASGAALPLSAQTADRTVRAVEKHYREMNTMTAKVIQKNFLKSLDRTQTFEGTIQIRKPGSLRLEYANGQLILIDGKQVMLYSRKNEQLIRRSFTDFAEMNLPAAFLLGAGRITDDFHAELPDPKKPGRIELIPRKPGAAMKKMGLTVDDNGRITELIIYDKSGNITEIGFSGIRENVPLDDKLFTFRPPKGTEIIEQ